MEMRIVVPDAASASALAERPPVGQIPEPDHGSPPNQLLRGGTTNGQTTHPAGSNPHRGRRDHRLRRPGLRGDLPGVNRDLQTVGILD